MSGLNHAWYLAGCALLELGERSSARAAFLAAIALLRDVDAASKLRRIADRDLANIRRRGAGGGGSGK